MSVLFSLQNMRATFFLFSSFFSFRGELLGDLFIHQKKIKASEQSNSKLQKCSTGE